MTISTLALNMRTQMNISNLQAQMNLLQFQVSSGKKAEFYSGLGVDTRTSIDFRNAQTQLETYESNITTIELRAGAMEPALQRIFETAEEVRNEMLRMRNGIEPDTTILNSRAQNAIDEVISLLNLRQDGRALFGGSDIDTNPVADRATIQALVNGMANPIQTYAGNAANVQTDLDALFAAAGTYYQSNDTGPNLSSADVDVGLRVEYGVRADNPAFADVLQGLFVAATITYDDTDDAGFWQLIDGAMGNLRTGSDAIIQEQAKLGDRLAQLERIKVRHSDTDLLLQRQLTAVEDVDIAEKTTELFTVRTQLEATYNLVAQSRQLTLASFL